MVATDDFDPAFVCALGRAPGLTAADLARAAQAAGSLGALAGMRIAPLREVGLDHETARAIAQPDVAQVAADLATVRRLGLTLLVHGARGYPPRLAELARPPPVLYVRGNSTALHDAQLAMVGSRNPTALGRRTAAEFAHFLAGAGITVTSGLALGIDSASHEGALAGGGRSVALCGTGLDIDYPRQNATLAARLAADGAVVSEFPPGTPPLPAHFPQRNRLISGLALGVLVVEAARESGSLITARCAAEQGREVFAIPGSIHSPLSQGCHELLREGAMLVTSGADILAALHQPLSLALGAASGKSFSNQSLTQASSLTPAASALDNDYEILLDALGFAPTGIDALIASTGLPGEHVASMLLLLELQGRIESLAGGRFARR
jgi:DNA processing protein